jgi:hypothetical protein
MRGLVIVPQDKRANTMSKRRKLRNKQLIPMWDIRFSNSVYFSYDLWDTKLSALSNGVVLWVEAAALSSDVKIEALCTCKTSRRIKQTTRCHILDDKSAHTVRRYINNTHLLGCYAVWRITKHMLTFRQSQVLGPTNCSWWRHYRYHSRISRTTRILIINVCGSLKPSFTWTSNSLWRYKLS